MTAGRNFPPEFLADAGSTFGAVAVDRKGRLKLSPENDLDANEAIVSDADTIPVHGETVTLAVANSVVTGTLPATKAIVTHEDPVEVNGVGGAEIAVAGNAVTGVTLPDTAVVLEDSAVVEYDGNTYTFTIVGGEITGIVVAPVE